MSCLGFQDDINKVAKDEDIDNMQVEEVIKKDKDTNTESAEVIQEESTMEDTENMQIDEVITVHEDTYPESTKATQETITEGPLNMLFDAVITKDGDTIPESTEASFLSTCHYYSNSNATDQFVIFLVQYHIKKIFSLL